MVYVGFDDQNVPANSFLPTCNDDPAGECAANPPGYVAGVMTLNLATRDAPP